MELRHIFPAQRPRLGRADEKLVLLASVPLFAGCTRRQLIELGRLTELCSVEPRTVLQAEGSPAACWRIVAEGAAAACRGGSPKGVVAVGDWWGERSLLHGEAASVTLVALTPMLLFEVDQRAFRTVATAFPSVTGRLIQELASRRAPYEEPAFRPALVG
jgi:CRP-like cAMP-binding protein